jgi:microcystin-dependent protein
MVAAKYLDPADGQWKRLPVPPHDHPGGATRIPGEVIAYAGATPPPGWLVCDGSEIKAADYPLLAAVLGTWGPSGAVFLPDLRDKSIIGVGTHALGTGDGSATHDHAGKPLPPHTHTGAALANHTHSVAAAATSSDSHKHSVNIDAFTSGSGGSHGHTTDTKGSHTHGMPTATQAVNPGVATIRHVTATETGSAGGHSHGVTSGGSHSHSVNPPATDSTSDAHSHTVAARATGPVSGGTPSVDQASAGTPDTDPSSSYHPVLTLNYIIFTGHA